MEVSVAVAVVVAVAAKDDDDFGIRFGRVDKITKRRVSRSAEFQTAIPVRPAPMFAPRCCTTMG